MAKRLERPEDTIGPRPKIVLKAEEEYTDTELAALCRGDKNHPVFHDVQGGRAARALQKMFRS